MNAMWAMGIAAAVAGATAPRPRSQDSAPVVVSKDEVWKRQFKEKPSGEDIPVSLPMVLVNDPVVQAKIDAQLTPEKLLGDSRATIEADGWVDGVAWSQTFSGQGVLGLEIAVEGSAAYPSGYVKPVVLDLSSGESLGRESFDPSRQPDLVRKLNVMLTARVAQAVAEEPEVAEILDGVHVSEDVLSNFSIKPEGVVFHAQFGLPHVVEAASPDPDFTVPWMAMRGFLAKGSPLHAVAAHPTRL